MKKLLLGLATILTLAGTAKGDVLATYNFSSNLTSSDANTNSTASDLTSSLANSQRVTTVGNGTPIASFNINKADVGNALDINGYVSFTLTAGSQKVLNLINLTFLTQGLPNWAVRSSVDSFASNLAITPTTAGAWNSQSVNLSGAQFQNLSSITFRIYGWSGNNGHNTEGYVDDITLNGTVPNTPVPEPINVALGVFGLAFVGVGAGRKFLKKKA